MTKGVTDARLGRREREKLAHRREILKAAERVFAEKGFDFATMEDVAKAAEFSIGAIYRFFDNKEALRGEVLENIAEEFYAEFTAVIERDAQPLDAITSVVQLRLRQSEEHSAFLRRIMDSKPGSQASPDQAIPPSCRKRYDAYLEDLASLLAKAVAAGQARKGDPVYMALALEGAMNAFWAYWGRKGVSLSMAEQIEIVRRNCLEMVLLKKGK